MKKLIAHRGNIDGAKPEYENTLNYLNKALDLGYDIEVDVRWNNGFYLGHDQPQEEISLDYLINSKVWVHCKDTESFSILKNYSVQCFCQENDLISPVYNTKYTWLHEKYRIDRCFPSNSIFTKLNVFSTNVLMSPNIIGICSDYPKHYLDYVPKDNIKLLLIDIDGVMAKNKTYDNTGFCIHKEFCDKDFTAIKMFKAAGIKVCFLSGDNWNRELAKNRNVKFIYSDRTANGIIDKISKLQMLYDLNHINDINQIIYIGDDYYDLDVIKVLEHSYCPADANPCIIKYSKVLNTKSGEGVIAELFDKFKDRLNFKYPGDNL